MTDFAGGMNPQDDYPLVEQPKGQPTFGENHAFWLFDQESRIYINTHLNSIETYWPMRRETVSTCLPNGRALVNQTEGSLTTRDTVGGANFTMHCAEPFKRWALKFNGTMIDTSQAALAAGRVEDTKRVLVHWQADVIIAAPPFIQGGTANASAAMTTTDAGRFIGGSRYEQLFRANVRFRIEGEDEIQFAATGTRTHRRGTRDVNDYAGHDWQSALFPSGDGFYFMRFPRADGTIAWSEAYLLKGGKLLPATVLSDTLIKSRQTSGEKMAIRLDSEIGVTEIDGETLGTIFRPMLANVGNPHGRYWGIHTEPSTVIALGQGWARYTMNGQAANGLCERSTFANRLTS